MRHSELASECKGELRVQDLDMVDGVSIPGDQFDGSHLLGQSEGFYQTKERMQ
jgi:hypothetical protein